MSYRKIEAALESHLQSLGLDNLVFAASRYKPKSGERYLVCNFLPGKVRRVLLGAETPQERRGFFQLNIHEIRHNGAMTRLDQRSAHFQSGLVLGFEGISVFVGTSEAGPDRGTLNHSNIPLSIRWRSYF